jgi:hypothetical protein
LREYAKQLAGIRIKLQDPIACAGDKEPCIAGKQEIEGAPETSRTGLCEITQKRPSCSIEALDVCRYSISNE